MSQVRFPAGITPASLGSGTPSWANYLRGDGKWTRPQGVDVLRRQSGFMMVKSGGTAVDTMGLSSALTGTATGASQSLTNAHTRMRRMDLLVTTASTTAVAGVRSGQSILVRGNAAGVGGFACEFLWGPATGVATSTMRAFAGLVAATAAPTDVEPSSLVNMVGMGWDAADTQVQIMTNDGTGTATKTAIPGTAWAVPTTDRTAAYLLRLSCEPNASTIEYEATELTTDTTVTGSLSTDLPVNTTYLGPRGYCSAGGTSSVIGFAFGGFWFEGDALV